MRYIHGDISHFLYKVIKKGEAMTEIMCCKSKCLNNKKGEKVHAVCVCDLMES